MRPRFRMIVALLLVLTSSGLAKADHEPATALDASNLRAVTTMQLDAVFEAMIARNHARRLHGLAGPSSMRCAPSAALGGVETCVVTTRQPTNPVPAAIAQH